MSIFSGAKISIDSLEDLDAVREYLFALEKEIRFMAQNIDADNFTEEGYAKIYANYEESNGLEFDAEGFEISFKNRAENLLTSLSVTKEEIELRVSTSELTNMINLSPEVIRIVGDGKLIVETDNLKIDADGNLKVVGEIIARGGNFGNFYIASDERGSYLQGNGKTYIKTAHLDGTDIYCSTMDITTDRDISGCSLDLSHCRVQTTNKTYFGWFYSGDVDAGGNTVFCNAAMIRGGLEVSGRVSAYDIWSEYEDIAYSDRRIKKDIRAIDGKEALKYLMKLRPVRYRIKGDKTPAYGLIAQDVLAAGDDYHIVHVRDGGYYSVEYGALNAVILAALKVQHEEVRSLCQSSKEAELTA